MSNAPRRLPRAGLRPLFAYQAGMVDAYTFTRPSVAVQRTEAGVFENVATSRVRDVHFLRNPATGLLERSTLLEVGRTNFIANPEAISAWSHNGAVLTGGQAGPDGAATAWLVDDQSTTGHGAETHGITAMGADGTKLLTFILKQGTAAKSAFGWLDVTANTWRAHATVVWNGSAAPTMVVNFSAGTALPPQSLGAGWWALSLITTSGVVAANNNMAYLYPSGSTDGTTPTGSVYFWFAQAENGTAAPSTPVRNAGVVGGRSTEILSFPYAAPPQEMTAYVRMFDVGLGTAGRLLVVSSTLAATQRSFGIFKSGTGNLFRGYLSNGSTAVDSQIAGTPTYGELVELRATVTAGGAVQLFRSVNQATEVAGTVGQLAPAALPATWTSPTLFLNSENAGSGATLGAYTHAFIFPGVRDLTFCRQRAGVG